MAPSRTSTMKSKHAAGKSAGGGKTDKRASTDRVSKTKKPKGPVVSQQLKEKNRALLMKKPKKKTYSAEELGIPTLNMITPVGVTKPKGKKKGKVFVDDRESMNTILSIVQAEKDGQIESKMIKARQMEEIREARQAEAEKKEQEKSAKLEDVKQSLRKKRKRKTDGEDDEINVKSYSSVGTKSGKSKKKVAFA